MVDDGMQFMGWFYYDYFGNIQFTVEEEVAKYNPVYFKAFKESTGHICENSVEYGDYGRCPICEAKKDITLY